MAWEQAHDLGKSRRWSVTDLSDPLKCVLGLRYMLVFSRESLLCHAVAVDESGNALDPDCVESRQHWSEYKPIGLLEFRK
jgi:hypothetical protein